MSSPSDQISRLKIAYVLYLDIVGYSLLRVDQQLRLIQELTELVRGADEFQRADKDLIALPTGDGMALVFLRNEPEAPILCALEIAESLRAQLHIQLRMGIHYGPIHLLHEDISGKPNVVGDGINLAQRVMDCGDAGHILLSSVVAEVLRKSGDWEPCLTDLGECEVKHGQLLRVFNLVKREAGNPARPAKMASTPAPTRDSLPASPSLKEGNPPPLVDTEIQPHPQDSAKPVSVPVEEPLPAPKSFPATPAATGTQLPASPPPKKPSSRREALAAFGVVAVVSVGGYSLWYLQSRPNTNGNSPPSSPSDSNHNSSPSLRVKAGTPTKTNPKDGAEMILIPAGEFLMGSKEDDQEAQGAEKPQRAVHLDAYYIYKNLVTVKQYMTFCDATGHKKPEQPSWGWQDDHPIVNVSWEDAKAYCDWAGAELPTEAEWEKAARGTKRQKYPWNGGWDAGKCANSVGSNSLKSTQPVGRYPQGASPYGVLDMAGNVWQWCADWYDANYYQTAPDRNPPGPTSSPQGYRVLRGGSWFNYNPYYFRCAYRVRYNPALRLNDYGFRCAVRADTF